MASYFDDLKKEEIGQAGTLFTNSDKGVTYRYVESPYGTGFSSTPKQPATLAGTTQSLGIAQPALPPGTPAPAAPKLPAASITPPAEVLAELGKKQEPRLTPPPSAPKPLASASSFPGLDAQSKMNPKPTAMSADAPAKGGFQRPEGAESPLWDIVAALHDEKVSPEEVLGQSDESQAAGILKELSTDRFYQRKALREKARTGDFFARKELSKTKYTSSPKNSTASEDITRQWGWD